MYLYIIRKVAKYVFFSVLVCDIIETIDMYTYF